MESGATVGRGKARLDPLRVVAGAKAACLRTTLPEPPSLTEAGFHVNVMTDFKGINNSRMKASLQSSMKSEKVPEKLAYKLEEVSRITQLDPAQIEAWEKEFYFLSSGQTASGEKIFRKKDLTIMLRLKELLEKKGLTLSGAKRKIEEEFGMKSPVPVHPDRLKKVLYQVREQLLEISSSLGKKSL